MFRVVIQQEENIVKFGFNDMSDAFKFMSDAFETGDEGTSITIYEYNTEDERHV